MIAYLKSPNQGHTGIKSIILAEIVEFSGRGRFDGFGKL
jgi:hypothetical protein